MIITFTLYIINLTCYYKKKESFIRNLNVKKVYENRIFV